MQYYEYMTEISSDELYKGLLAYGLFSDKLPPIFTSDKFYEYCLRKRHNFEQSPHNYVYFENMRSVNVPRPLAIPNPMAYQLLCDCLKSNWENIKQHFIHMTDFQTYKVSRIHIRKIYQSTALFEMNYDNWRVDGSPEIDLAFGKRYLVKADISSCFPSTYTHAIPWALVGKQIAKANRNLDFWYNSIDSLSRHIKHDETQGLLIGPHTSNLLSEIILTAIDKEMKVWKYTRNIDDYLCYVDTYEDAQKFLTELGASLRAYSLNLNHKKTEIVELPFAVTEHWLRKLNKFNLLNKHGSTDYNLAQAYLDYAVELMHENKNNASILYYAIKVLAGSNLTSNAREYCAKTIMNLSMLYPYLVITLDEFVFSKYCVGCQDHKCIKDYSSIVFMRGLQSRNYELVSYSLFFAIKYGFLIDNFNVNDVINSKDCVAMLFASIYAKELHDSQSTQALKAVATAFAMDDDTFDQNWLFAYEVLSDSKLPSNWKALKRSKVTFVKPRGNW